MEEQDARDVIERAVKHPIREAAIKALWHSGEPLSAAHLSRDYLKGSESIGTVNYHLQTLERDGVLHLDHEQVLPGSTERFYVVGGENSAEAIRRLKLS